MSELDQLLAAYRRVDFADTVLLQPAQAPVTLYQALEIGIGAISCLEIAHRAKQFGRFLGKRWCFALQAGNQLPLIDQIAIAA